MKHKTPADTAAPPATPQSPRNVRATVVNTLKALPWGSRDAADTAQRRISALNQIEGSSRHRTAELLILDLIETHDLHDSPALAVILDWLYNRRFPL
jgi:hypothetical protein